MPLLPRLFPPQEKLPTLDELRHRLSGSDAVNTAMADYTKAKSDQLLMQRQLEEKYGAKERGLAAKDAAYAADHKKKFDIEPPKREKYYTHAYPSYGALVRDFYATAALNIDLEKYPEQSVRTINKILGENLEPSLSSKNINDADTFSRLYSALQHRYPDARDPLAAFLKDVQCELSEGNPLKTYRGPDAPLFRRDPLLNLEKQHEVNVAVNTARIEAIAQLRDWLAYDQHLVSQTALSGPEVIGSVYPEGEKGRNLFREAFDTLQKELFAKADKDAVEMAKRMEAAQAAASAASQGGGSTVPYILPKNLFAGQSH